MSHRLSLSVIVLLLISLFISSCGKSNGESGIYPYGHYEDDKMIGTVIGEMEEDSRIIIDISEWEKRDRRGPNITEEGYSYKAVITDETIIQHENESSATLQDLEIGQKVLVNPPRGDDFEGEADEIILLKMSHE